MLPTFLFEQKYERAEDVIDRLYTECPEQSLILGVFKDEDLCGLAELYGYREPLHKISIGCRLVPEKRSSGIATAALRLLAEYLENEKGIEIITANCLPDNHASEALLKKLGFTLVVHDSSEDWGYNAPLPTDK